METTRVSTWLRGAHPWSLRGGETFVGVRTGYINPGEPVGSLAHFPVIHTGPVAWRAPMKVTRQYIGDRRHAEEMTEDT